MASDETWNVSGLAPELREAAREAARRHGVSVEQWLQAAIADSAAEDGVVQPSRWRGGGERSRRPEDRDQVRTGAVQAVQDRLGPLNRTDNDTAIPTARATAAESEDLAAALRSIESQLAALTNPGPTASSAAQQLTDALAHLDQRLDGLMSEDRSTARELDRRIAAVDQALAALNHDQTGAAAAPRADPTPAFDDWTQIDRAVAQITQRQRALDAEAPGSLKRQFVALSRRLDSGDARPPIATIDQSQLKDQLRQLADELQTWRRSGGFHDALLVLREELGEIGRKFTEAAPRQALQALEAEVRTLVERVDRDRLHGADSPALAGIERGLAEVREALRQFAPAESLTGFRDEVRALDRKLDWVAANADGSGLKQLETSVAELREIASHAASGEALIALAEEVQAIADKLDKLANPAFGSELLSNLERRFEALAAEFAAHDERPQSDTANNLVGIVEALAAKLDHLDAGHDTRAALDAISNQLARLTERIESTDTRLDNLDHIERTFSDLMNRLDGMQGEAVAAAERAARDAALEIDRRLPGFEVDSLKQDIDALRDNQSQSDRHIQDTLEVVHDTLERLVDRLAMVETNIRADSREQAAKPAKPIEPAHAPPLVPMHAPPEAMRGVPISAGGRRAPAAVGPTESPSAERRPIDPTLPADHPLEPGAGRALRPGASAAERIAASEAALGAAKPAAESDAKSNFIAAARRAAQAAANMSPPPEVDSETTQGDTSAPASLMQRIVRRRPLLLGAAVLIVAGGAHVAFNIAGLKIPGWRDRGPAEQAQPAAVTPIRATAKGTSTSVNPSAAKPPTAAALVAEGESPDAPAGSESRAAGSMGRDPSAGPTSSAAASASRPDAKSTPTVSPLTIASIQLPVGNVTGSIGRTTGAGRSSNDVAPTLPTAPSPAAGTPRAAALPAGLQTAAASGNPAAEYEIATRYVDGRGVARHLEEAARWFERAANRELAPAQYRLASLYEKGQGVKKDLELARRLYRAAAEKGNGKAMHNLAVLYAEGIDGSPDFKAAAQWFRKAAQRGLADSQYNLGILYARGLGVETDLTESYKWFTLSAQQGDRDAGKKRDDIAARLDQATAAAAEQAVQAFSVEPQPEDAITVKAPPGGWENIAPAASIGKPKHRPSGARKVAL